MRLPFPCRPPLATAFISLALLSPAARAADAAPALKAAPVEHATQAAAKSSRQARDPLDTIRERLAEKLGAVKAPEAAAGNVLRVVSRPSVRTPATPHGRVARVAEGQRESPAAGHAAHWDYQGEGGPQAWAQLKPDFATCSSGKRQSPIDIRDGIKVQLDAVQFDYRASAFRVIDTGHTVQVNVGTGNFIEVSGRRYELLQFHFHRPSEERINGRVFDMVVHLVHKDIDGRLAVLAVLLDRGSAQPLVQAVWNNLPLEQGEEVAARLPVDLNELLPSDRSYYTYMGSLTTPPCSEGVLWLVMKNPVPVSAEQIAIFARLYPMNARPIQSASGRMIKESN
jgi:carbonic anhydrase